MYETKLVKWMVTSLKAKNRKIQKLWRKLYKRIVVYLLLVYFFIRHTCTIVILQFIRRYIYIFILHSKSILINSCEQNILRRIIYEPKQYIYDSVRFSLIILYPFVWFWKYLNAFFIVEQIEKKIYI